MWQIKFMDFLSSVCICLGFRLELIARMLNAMNASTKRSPNQQIDIISTDGTWSWSHPMLIRYTEGELLIMLSREEMYVHFNVGYLDTYLPQSGARA